MKKIKKLLKFLHFFRKTCKNINDLQGEKIRVRYLHVKKKKDNALQKKNYDRLNQLEKGKSF
ncbi:hypothetical protein CJP74_01570 [Psittacicella melopsittaci]|uniref:Uncharacterized protein n=1 Tax=Psittacicella melopsittaci TaxID=2028576 RepID=A0A3A1Y7T0_9GAMM|nr:hypothetical protein CJP74_01570 [Psittacicella melopsittaci]